MNPARQYQIRFWAAMIAYAVVLVAAISILNRLPKDNLLRYPVALLPVVPILFGVAAYLRYVRQIDELQQKIHLEAVAFSLGLTGILTFALGFLEIAGLPQVGMIWVFPLSIALWGLGIARASRRYS